MRSLVSALRGQSRRDTKTPVPYAPRYFSNTLGSALMPSGTDAQLRSFGANGTLFAVVEGFTTAVASVAWHVHRSAPQTVNPISLEQQERPPVPHAALDLWNRPNNFFSRPRLVKTFQQHKELIGEGILVVVKMGNLPLELWPVRPDRMEPIPHPDKYLVGWVYHAEDGQTVPLGVDQVIQMIGQPCPWDPYRGIGAVATIMLDLYGDAAAAEWHRSFFKNSARPDGVIEVPVALSDTEWEEFQQRWRDTHQGANNAFRVAMLEHGSKWVPTAYSMHDMQFTELRRASHENIRGAFRMPKTVLGEGESLNRATAEAQLFLFNSELIVPRLNDIRDDGLNFRLLPMYGATGANVEFDYVDPVPEDAEAADRRRVSQAQSYEIYVRSGVDPAEAAKVCGLPPMKTAPRPAVPDQAPPAPGEGKPPAKAKPKALPAAHTSNGHHRVALAFGRHPHRHALPRGAADPAEEDEPDLSGVLTDLQEALRRLQADFAPIDQVWFDAIADQVAKAVEAGDRKALASMTLDTTDAEELITEALAAMEATAAGRAARETAAQGVNVEPGEPTEEEEDDAGLAEFAAALIAGWLLAAAAKEALRLWLASEPVVAGVLLFLGALKHVARWAFLAWLLHRATNRGRYWTFRVAVEAVPGGVAFASEVNDRNRCSPCGDFDGHRFATLDEAFAMYGGGGYPLCEGRERCRGTWHVVWPQPE